MSTRMFVTECFDGNHAACKGYNGPAENPNFHCDCDCHRTTTQNPDSNEQQVHQGNELNGKPLEVILGQLGSPASRQDVEKFRCLIEDIRRDERASVAAVEVERFTLKQTPENPNDH